MHIHRPEPETGPPISSFPQDRRGFARLPPPPAPRNVLAMTDGDSSQEQLNVVIVGGGVAALEAALALRELGGARIASTILAPDPEFVYRPMTVREPFGYATARRYPLD